MGESALGGKFVQIFHRNNSVPLSLSAARENTLKGERFYCIEFEFLNANPIGTSEVKINLYCVVFIIQQYRKVQH